MEARIKVGISSCLLGEKVRYDGGHKLDHYLKETLGKYVEWIPVCPETEIGLSVPREAMRLVGDPKFPRLVTIRTAIDYTERMLNWAEEKLIKLHKVDLCGFVFKSRSPSSGLRGVKVYGASGVPSATGMGIFAKAFVDKFPFLPVEDDGRLHDPVLRENFIERIFVYRRWQNLIQKGGSAGDLVSFHTDHKLLLLAHSPKHYTILGKIVARAGKYKHGEIQFEYLKNLMEGLRFIATVKKNTNVLQHIAGYLRRFLSSEEKLELQEIISDYHKGLIPLIVPITLINHYVRKYGEQYLKRQYYLAPHPLELMLRNHV